MFVISHFHYSAKFPPFRYSPDSLQRAFHKRHVCSMGFRFLFFWRTFWTHSSVRHLVLWDDPGACKAGFLIINAQLSPCFSLWTCWLAVNVLQVIIVNQTTVTFWHIFSKYWASCLSFPLPTCLPSTELGFVRVLLVKCCNLFQVYLTPLSCGSPFLCLPLPLLLASSFSVSFPFLPLSYSLPHIPSSSGYWQGIAVQ